MQTEVLSPLKCSQEGKYRYELASAFRVRISEFLGRVKYSRDLGTSESGAIGEGSWQVWAMLTTSGELVIYPGYAWDGCSPATKLFGKWVGTPTPPSVRAACLVHDVLYQFLDEGLWTRAEADAVFLSLMKSAGFPLAPIYYGAVRLFGGLHHLLFR